MGFEVTETSKYCYISELCLCKQDKAQVCFNIELSFVVMTKNIHILISFA